jgi:hypothetical protein
VKNTWHCWDLKKWHYTLVHHLIYIQLKKQILDLLQIYFCVFWVALFRPKGLKQATSLAFNILLLFPMAWVLEKGVWHLELKHRFVSSISALGAVQYL